MARDIFVELAINPSKQELLTSNLQALRVIDTLCRLLPAEITRPLKELTETLEQVAGPPTNSTLFVHAGFDLADEAQLANDLLLDTALIANAQTILSETVARLRSNIAFDLEHLTEADARKRRKNKKSGLLDYIAQEAPRDLYSLHMAMLTKACIYARHDETDCALTVLENHAIALTALLSHEGWSRLAGINTKRKDAALRAAFVISCLTPLHREVEALEALAR